MVLGGWRWVRIVVWGDLVRLLSVGDLGVGQCRGLISTNGCMSLTMVESA